MERDAPSELQAPRKRKKAKRKQPIGGLVKEAVDQAFMSHVQDIIKACKSSSRIKRQRHRSPGPSSASASPSDSLSNSDPPLPSLGRKPKGKCRPHKGGAQSYP